MNDTVNNPEHYNRNGIEVIDVIETYTPNSPQLANVLKYVCRHSYKGKPLEDLRKAAWYLDRAITILEGEEDERAWVEEQMNDPECIALRERIRDAVLVTLGDETLKGAPSAEFEVNFASTPLGWQDFPGLDADDFENDECIRDEYGRVLRASPPVNIDGEPFPVEPPCHDDLGRCTYTGKPCTGDGDCKVDTLDRDGPFEKGTDGTCCPDVWRNEPSSSFITSDARELADNSDAVYVNPPLQGRVAGQVAPHIYKEFYNYDANEVLDVCWNGCGEVIEAGELYLTHCGKAFCSTKCVDDFKFWQGGE